MDDFFPIVIHVFILILALLGTFFIGDMLTSTTLSNSRWNCTEVSIDNGKPTCIKYERVKK